MSEDEKKADDIPLEKKAEDIPLEKKADDIPLGKKAEDIPLEKKEPEKKEPEIISIKKSTYNKLIVGLIVAIGIAAFLGGFGVGFESAVPSENVIQDSGVQRSANQPQSQLQSSSVRIAVSLDDDPVKGDPNAPITMIEFSDFQCPFCGKFFSTTLPLIEKNYIETGKVKFVYRDFPIPSIHPNAVPAALAAECADDQGKFWEYHDKLFEKQRQWESLDAQNGIRTFEQFAEELDLDSDTFNTCLESTKYLAEVQNDLDDGLSYGVTGTPGFIIGNEKIGFVKLSGAQPYSVFERVIEQQLAS